MGLIGPVVKVYTIPTPVPAPRIEAPKQEPVTVPVKRERELVTV